ncbi:hypothetical protein ONZ45_g7955 [Pleurotus djamor]|nr:hypothetical protein ONZ45_g7955 [Pleurotus djamor]
MSARQQFFPIASRPASRANNEKENAPPPAQQFKPDLSNPLHQKPANANSVPNPQTKHHSSEPKQLNLSSLKKPRPVSIRRDNQARSAANDGHDASLQRSQSIRRAWNSPTSLASPAPRNLQSISQLLETSPRRSHTPTGHAMKSFLGTGSATSSEGLVISSENAHISTHGSDMAAFSLSNTNLDASRSPGHGAINIRRPSLNTGFDGYMPSSAYQGPQRVPVEENQDDYASEMTPASIARATKRGRPEYEHQPDDDVLPPGAIRIKRPHRDQDNLFDPRAMTSPHQLAAPSTPPLSGPPALPKESALSKVFGVNVDEYVVANMDKYEEAREKWKSCTMDEWVSGADELAHRFAQMLDFVKDHMTTKIKLFADMNKSVDDHNVILDERKQSLVKAKEQLVKNSGAVLGR